MSLQGILFCEDARMRFWRDVASWKVNSSSHLFLARVVHQLGHEMFPGEWTGEEPGAPWFKPLPPALDACTLDGDVARAQRLLLQHHAGYRERLATPDQIFLPIPTQEEWSVAFELSRSLAELTKPLFERFIAVVHMLIALFECGALPTAVRELDGGYLEPLHPVIWNGENVAVRFRTCIFIQRHRSLPKRSRKAGCRYLSNARHSKSIWRIDVNQLPLQRQKWSRPHQIWRPPLKKSLNCCVS